MCGILKRPINDDVLNEYTSAGWNICQVFAMVNRYRAYCVLAESN